jgi:hypothetical protein
MDLSVQLAHVKICCAIISKEYYIENHVFHFLLLILVYMTYI